MMINDTDKETDKQNIRAIEVNLVGCVQKVPSYSFLLVVIVFVLFFTENYTLRGQEHPSVTSQEQPEEMNPLIFSILRFKKSSNLLESLVASVT